MKIYGKITQNGTPTPEYPVEIKTGQVIVVKGKDGNIIKELPLDLSFDLKNVKQFYKEGDKWYVEWKK